jgi:hypothetical protein
MDSISGVSSTTYLPQSTASTSTSTSTPVSVPVPADSVTLSDASDAASSGVYSPDAGFTSLLQADPGLAQDYAADSQFGFDNPTLSSDDTLSPSEDTTNTSASSDVEAAAVKTELSALNFTGGVASALLGGMQNSSSVFFMGASMSNLLTANGSAALAYLTPQAASTSGSVDLSA